MSRIRIALVGVAAAGLMLMSANAALADNLQQNDLSAVPAEHTVEVGVPDATSYQLTANNGDGQNGCNASPTSPAVVTINVPAGVTASPSTLTFTTCQQADPNNAQTVSFSANAPGDYQITATVSDSGPGIYNTSPASFTLQVVAPPAPSDTTAPVITAPSNMVVEATGPSGAVVTYNLTATDDVDGPVAVTSAPASGSTFPLGLTTVSYSASDAAGNSASGSFTVNVVDTTPPVLPDLSNIDLDATSAAGAVANYGPASATDLVDGSVPVVFTPVSGSTFALGTHPVSYTATDAAGNTAVAKSFNVKVLVLWNGLNQPINRAGSSVFKLGSTVPVKFNSFPGLNATLSVTKADAAPDGTDLEAVNSNPADTGNLFRYDVTAGQYIFNLGTKNLSAGDWNLHVFLGDGVDHVTKISLRK